MRRDMDHRPDDIDLDAEIRGDGAVEHLTRVQPDPCPPGHTSLAQFALDAEAGKAGAHRVVLMGDRRAEQRQDTVAQPPADHALVAMDQPHHDLHRGLDLAERRLRIEALDRGSEVL